MKVECVAIVFVVLGIAFTFLRANRPNYAVSVLPLLLVPLAHLGSNPVARLLIKMTGLSTLEARVLFDVFALILACILFSLLSTSISSKKSRTVFVFCCGLFSLILTGILILNVMRV